MSPPAKPWGKAIDRLLADGEWHDREDLLQAAIRAVPPGPAYRRGEGRRVAHTKGGPRQRGGDVRAIAAGARALALDALRARVEHGNVDRLDGPGVIRYRRRGGGRV